MELGPSIGEEVLFQLASHPMWEREMKDHLHWSLLGGRRWRGTLGVARET